jgi:hypothetical protein
VCGGLYNISEKRWLLIMGLISQFAYVKRLAGISYVKKVAFPMFSRKFKANNRVHCLS